MPFLIYIALMLILYGLLCFLGREALWRLAVPRHAEKRVNPAIWDRVTTVSGLLAIGLGMVLIFNAVR